MTIVTLVAATVLAGHTLCRRNWLTLTLTPSLRNCARELLTILESSLQDKVARRSLWESRFSGTCGWRDGIQSLPVAFHAGQTAEPEVNRELICVTKHGWRFKSDTVILLHGQTMRHGRCRFWLAGHNRLSRVHGRRNDITSSQTYQLRVCLTLLLKLTCSERQPLLKTSLQRGRLNVHSAASAHQREPIAPFNFRNFHRTGPELQLLVWILLGRERRPWSMAEAVRISFRKGLALKIELLPRTWDTCWADLGSSAPPVIREIGQF